MTPDQVPFHTIVKALQDSPQFPAAYLKYFSDIDPDSLASLKQAWPEIPLERKRSLLERLEALIDEDTLVSFDDLARWLLDDPDAEVRGRALRLLVECEDPRLVPACIRMMEADSGEDVRAEAAGLLGSFVMLGELEEIAPKVHHEVEDALLRVANGEGAPAVRRRALESMGFSSRPEATALIESAFRRSEPSWKASALFAMGRSSDERWREHVMEMLMNDQPAIRLAAVQAAGELGLTEARPVIFRILEDEEEDDVTSAAIWSLSQIGGEDARIFLENLIAETEDDEMTGFLEDALENLAFNEDLERFELMSFDPEDEEPED